MSIVTPGEYGEPIADTSELMEYLTKIVDHRLRNAIYDLVRECALDNERRLTVDAALATLASALVMHLVCAPESDESVLQKASFLPDFIFMQVHAHRTMRNAMSESDDATHH